MSTDQPFILQREAEREPFIVDLEGQKLALRHIADLDQIGLGEHLVRPMDDTAFITAVLRLAMSGDDFAALRAAKPTRKMLTDMWGAYQKHCGIDAGESQASSD